MKTRRRQPALKVTLTYTPAFDYAERLRKVMELLLKCPNPTVNGDTKNAEMENRATH